MAREYIQSADHKGVGYRTHRPFLPQARGQTALEGGELCLFSVHGRMGEWGEPGTERLIPFPRASETWLSRACIVT
jgi:hypothetical protein